MPGTITILTTPPTSVREVREDTLAGVVEMPAMPGGS